MSRLRLAICKKISEIAKNEIIYHELEVPSKKQLSTIGNKPVLQWAITTQEQLNKITQLLPNFRNDEAFVENVRLLPPEGKNLAKVEFQLQPQAFTAAVLQDTNKPTPLQTPAANVHHMVFEYSSPNIAKPFHVGHLRSTIIGNMLANLHEHLGYKVTKLNYLGDWGTQLGMLQVGVDLKAVTEEQMRLQPIETLYQAYVAANTAAKTDATVVEKARKYFHELESEADVSMAKQWELYRTFTVAELKNIYARLGVHFDSYEWESQYSQHQIGEVLASLADKSLLSGELDGRKVVEVDGRRVPIIKSDGNTLYLARDIAALLDRFKRYSFERIFYIVENGQSDHFNACFKTTAALCEDLPLERLAHVKFGRIHGMSTRSGNAIFLRDVLDEARDIMLEKQLKSSTTKVELTTHSKDFKGVADVLGVSAVLINDLKQRRQRDYEFDWTKALQVNGDTGIKLQYTHCRLYNLLKQVSHIEANEELVCTEHLSEPEAQDLLLEIARFEQAVWQAKKQLEACVLVNYLFTLCNTTSRALKRLNVKNEKCLDKQLNRILLFSKAKQTLHQGMLILGLKPLNQM